MQRYLQYKTKNLVNNCSSLLLYSSTKDEYLQSKFNDRNQVDDKIAWGLGAGFLCF